MFDNEFLAVDMSKMNLGSSIRKYQTCLNDAVPILWMALIGRNTFYVLAWGRTDLPAPTGVVQVLNGGVYNIKILNMNL